MTLAVLSCRDKRISNHGKNSQKTRKRAGCITIILAANKRDWKLRFLVAESSKFGGQL